MIALLYVDSISRLSNRQNAKSVLDSSSIVGSTIAFSTKVLNKWEHLVWASYYVCDVYPTLTFLKTLYSLGLELNAAVPITCLSFRQKRIWWISTDLTVECFVAKKGHWALQYLL